MRFETKVAKMGRNARQLGNRRLAMLAAGSLLAGALPFAVGAQQSGGAAPMCISQTARQNLSECPAGAPPPGRRAGAGASAPETHLTETKRREEEKKQGPTGPGFAIDAATARGREATRSRALELLQREVSTTQRIVDRMREDDPRGAEYLLRLAETYFELQSHWNAREREVDQPLYEAQQAGNQERVQQLQRQQQEAHRQLDEARQSAIRTYAQLLQRYPNFARRDEVLFSLAFGLEEMRQFDRARQVYFQLIKAYPESRFIPYAYLSFAEYYFGEGDMRAAQQFYTKVTEFPPERNPIYGYALYKQAWALYNLEDFSGALRQFARTIEFAQQNPDSRDSVNLGRQSRRELVLPYSRVGRPSQALEFFQRYADPQHPEQAFEMLESLGELYYDTGQWPETIQVYHRLMAEQSSGDRVCYWQTRVTNAIISSRPKAEQVTEIQRLIDIYNQFSSGRHPAEAVNECKAATATVLVELSTAWHREAIGTDEQPGTNDRNTMNQSARLYRLTLDTFPDLDQLEFESINREDWPTVYKVSYFYAELLWRMENWEQCGPAFDRVVELNPQGEFTTDAAYASVLCYNNLYQQQYASSERERRETREPASGGGRRGRRGRRAQQQEQQAPSTAPQEMTPVQAGMLRSFQRFVCYVQDSEELPQVKYRRCRIYYETNHFEEAAVCFDDVWRNHRESELAEFAANLYLDSLILMAPADATEDEPARDGNAQCLNEIDNALNPLHETYCSNQEARDAHPDLCERVIDLRCARARMRAETAARRGDHRAAANAYREIVQRYRECGRLDEVIYNLAIEYESARLLGRAIRARTTLIQRFPESPLAKRAIYLVGANYHALAIYSQAADWYERFARGSPGAEFPIGDKDRNQCNAEEREDPARCAVAYSGLENAVFFRLGLGEEDRAIDDVRLYESSYRRSRARETSQVVFSLGSIYERQGNWERVLAHYRGWLRNYGRQALPHEVIRAHVQMGRAEWETEDHRPRAEDYFRDATRAWGNAPEQINRLQATDEEKALWLARAKNAASEAFFYLAEYKFAEFRAIRFPRAPSARTISAVTRWSQQDLLPWLNEKREALQRAEAAYNLVAPLEVPEWQIAAAARIGEMYQTIVDQMRSAPIPEEIENDPELYDIYVDAMEGALNGSGPGPDGRPFTPDDVACTPDSQEPQCVSSPVRQAMSKFEFCRTLATRVRWFNEFSQSCEIQLNRLDAQRYPLAAELRGTASFIQDQIAPPEPVELTTGEDAEDAEGAAGGDQAVTTGGTS